MKDKPRVFDLPDRTIVASYGSQTDHIKELPNRQANFAMALVERWGMIVGLPDGEDSNGRAKLRLMTPAEVVTRAVETAEAMESAARERGWIITAPSYAEMHGDLEAGTSA